MSTETPGAGAPEAGGGRHRPDVLGRRAIAILMVIPSLGGVPGMSGGYLGVDVFFVLSGCLIQGNMADKVGRTGSPFLLSRE